MAYQAEINRSNPTCFLFLLDQSASMSEPFGNSTGSGAKSIELSRIINRLLQTLVIRCARETHINRYFDVGIIGYGKSIGSAFGGALSGRQLVGVDELAENPIRIEEVTRRIPDGAGAMVDAPFKMPVWFDPVANNGTPMAAAFGLAYDLMADWVNKHRSAFPPVLMNISDGEPTGDSPLPVADKIKKLATDDGNVLLMNLHLSSSAKPAVKFPHGEDGLPDSHARLLYQMSSVLPAFMVRLAAQQGSQVTQESRAFVFNADMVESISFLEIGTRASNLR